MTYKLIFILLLTTAPAVAFSQAAAFDVFKFTAPPGFAKEDRNAALAYTSYSNTRGIYCIIVLYASENSKGNAGIDFTNFWNRVVKPLRPAAEPQMEDGATINGWTSLRGFSTFSQNSAVSQVALQTYTSNDKTAAVLYLFNDTTYLGRLNDFSTALAPDYHQAAVASNGSSQIAAASPSNYTAPRGWRQKDENNGITSYTSPLMECREFSYYTLHVFKTVVYNGNLLDYATQLYSTYFSPSGNGKYLEYQRRLSKGIDELGREFAIYEDGAQIFNDNTYHYGITCVVRNGNQMASFILELNPLSSNSHSNPNELDFFFGCNPLKKAWQTFLTSVKFSTPTASKNTLPEDLEGSWISRVHLGWTEGIFGNYSYDKTQELEKYSFSANGKFSCSQLGHGKSSGTISINGNRLSLQREDGKIITYRFRLESIFDGRWHRSLTFYSNDEKEITLNFEANE